MLVCNVGSYQGYDQIFLACGNCNQRVHCSFSVGCILPRSHKMVLILILAADTRCTAQSASIQRPIQLSYAICARSDRGGWRELRGCAAAAIDEKRGQQQRKLFPASMAHRSHFATRSRPVTMHIQVHACRHACGRSASRQYLIATRGTAASHVTLVETGLRHRQVLGRPVCDLTLVGTGVFDVHTLLQSIYVGRALHAPCCLVLCLTSA